MNKALLKRAGEHHRRGEFEQALSCYRQLLVDEPTNAEIMHAIAILLSQLGEHTDALSMIDKAIQTDDKNATLFNSKGNILLRQQDYDKAASAFKIATKIKPNYAKAFNNLGNCLSTQNKLHAAKLAYEKAIKYEPYYADAHTNYGILLARLENYDEAINALKNALHYADANPKTLGQLSQVYLSTGQYAEAISLLEQRLKHTPNHTESWHSLGLAYLLNDDPIKAIAALETTLKLNPQHSSAEHELGTAYLQLQQTEKALQHYLRQLEHNPMPETFYNIGVLLMYRERNREALEYFSRCLELDPTNIGAHLNLGSIFLKANAFTEANKHYQAALELRPNDPEIQYLLAAINNDQQPERAPERFLEHLFDQYSSYYDKHLTECLQYQVPKLIHQAVFTASDIPTAKWQILDIGCGTGLCGEEFKPQAKKLIGIDISQGMIDIANSKNVYDELQVGDISTLLSRYHNIDLVTAADVFTYIGKLDEIFRLVHDCLAPQGLFVFSVEKTAEYPFLLQKNTRYAHSEKYLNTLIADNQFATLDFANITLRFQHKKPVEGYLVLLQKTEQAK